MIENAPHPTDDLAADAALSLAELCAEAVAGCVEVGVFRAAAPCGLADEQLLAGLVVGERLGRIVDSLRVQMAGLVEDRCRTELGAEGLAASNNFSNAADLITALTSVSKSTALARIRLGKEVRSSMMVGTVVPARFPEVQDAFGRGLIGVDTADAIIKPLKEVTPTVGTGEIRDAERELVQLAIEG